jgi:hypothetical protein
MKAVLVTKPPTVSIPG